VVSLRRSLVAFEICGTSGNFLNSFSGYTSRRQRRQSRPQSILETVNNGKPSSSSPKLLIVRRTDICHRDGTDGQWSSFPLRVGTPAQNVRVFISTASTTTWVIDDQYGCAGFTFSDCAKTRGGLFASNESSTYNPIGPGSGFDLVVESQLGMNATGELGFDTGRFEMRLIPQTLC
jgi:hypothetical protein